MLLAYLVGCILFAFLLFGIWIKYSQSYWKRRGIYEIKPIFFFGAFKDIFLHEKALGQTILDLYRDIKSKTGRYGGFYIFTNPFFMPVNLDVIKGILVKDFEYFINHGIYFHEEYEPLTGNLFSLEGDKWKTLRAKLTPTFTSGKMKYMFPSIVTCTENLKTFLNKTSGKPVDIKEILARYTMDIIGCCAFGVRCNCIDDPDSEFRKYGKKILEWNWKRSFSRLLTNTLPKEMCPLLGIKVIDPEVSRFFMDLVKNTVEFREKHNLIRQDFMHLLLQLKNQGEVMNNIDATTTIATKPSNQSGISLEEIAAQCFIFFFAGFESSATTMTFALYELAQNQGIQCELRKEIIRVWEKYGNTYDAITKMEYLEKIIYETLRKYPPVVGTTRICNKQYKIPDSDIVIEKGVKIHIPIIGIHMDPTYYPDPEKFDPNRFDEDSRSSRPAFTWLPFGEGPRICIGSRFGLLQTKIGVATIIKNFHISINKKTELPIIMDPGSLVYSSKNPIWLDITRI